MLLKGGFSKGEIDDANRYIKFGSDYNKPSPFTNTLNFFNKFSDKMKFSTTTRDKSNWVLALIIFANNFLFLLSTALILVLLNFIIHWEVFHYITLILLGLGLGIVNSKIISGFTNKNHKLVISYVLSPLLVIMFITVYYAISAKLIGVFGNFTMVDISGFASLMKGSIINPGVASFVFLLFFNSVLLSQMIKERTIIKDYYYYGLALIHIPLSKVLISAVGLVVVK